MKKRWLSLLLGLCMILPLCLTGCSLGGDKDAAEDIADQASDRASTIVMYIVTEDETDPEAAARVAEQISSITKSQFKTQLVIRYLTADEYLEVLEADMKKMEEAYDEDTLWASDDEDEDEKKKKEETEETDYNEYGIPETKYPDALDFQVDIIYISGLDMYKRYIDKGWLASLNTAMLGTAQKMRDYISPALMDGAKEGTTLYGIPNNCQIGEYTYLLLNRAVANKYFYSSSLDEFADVGGRTLGRFLADADNEGLLPFDGSIEDLILLGGRYWSINPTDYSIDNEFSIIGDFIDDLDKMARGDVEVAFDNLALSPAYVSFLRTLVSYQINGYFGTASGDEAVGAKIVKGDVRLPELDEYKDYYVIPIRMPQASNAEVFDNMLAVSKFTQDVTKTMEVVTLINTNAEVRNLLQYGIEGVNYVLNEDGQVSRLDHSYMMDLKKTGNMFIAYPDVEAGYASDAWEYARVQNRDAILNPLLGFDFKVRLPYDYSSSDEDADPVQLKLDATALKFVKNESKKVLDAIKECTSLEDFDTLTASWKTAYAASVKEIKTITNKTSDNAPYKVYLDWANAGKFMPGQAEKETSESDSGTES